jgi:gliding motility-associated-like protein
MGGYPVGIYEIDHDFSAADQCSASSTRYFISVLEGVNAGNPGKTDICDIDSPINLLSIIDGNYDLGGTWSDLNNSGVDLNDPTSVSFSNVSEASYAFQYEVLNNGNCSGDDLNEVTVNVFRVPNAGSSNILTIGLTDSTIVNLMTTLLDTPDPGGTWTEQTASGVDLKDPTGIDFTDTSKGTYIFEYSVLGSVICGDAMSTVTINVNNEAVSSDVKPSGGFSPDGDGINEQWQIPNIEQFPNNFVQIFNRWGQLVFEIRGYNNQNLSFEGMATSGAVVGSGGLPEGTYFYLIDLGDGSPASRGFLTIAR